MSDAHKAAIIPAPPVEITQRMHPLVEKGIQAVTDPAVLEKFLALQERWEAGLAKQAYTRAMVALKRDLPIVLERDKVVDFTNRAGVRTYYRHVSLAALTDAVTPILTQHGFTLNWYPTTAGTGTGTHVTVVCRLTHADGHYEESAMTAPLDTSGSKSPAQGIMSTVTLLQRYTAIAMLGLSTADSTEPQGEPQTGVGDKPAAPAASSGKVDANRNLRAVGRLKREHGISSEEAEKFVGKPVSDWTDEDLRRIAGWVEPKDEEPPEPGASG